jgi:sulfite exporter TauE/SafE
MNAVPGNVLTAGLVLGLSTGAACLVTCAPAMLPYIVTTGWESPKISIRQVLEFLGGRLAAYLLFGVIVGLVGRPLQDSAIAMRVSAGLLVLFAALLVLQGFSVSLPEWRGCKVLGRNPALRRFPFIAGFVIGINVCPPFAAALTYMLTVGRVPSCVGFSLAFFAGTVVYMIPLFLTGFLGKVPSIRGIAQVAAIFGGLWFLASGISLWMKV